MLVFLKAGASNSGLESPISVPVLENGTLKKKGGGGGLSLSPEPALLTGIACLQLCLQPHMMSGLCLFGSE